MFLWSVTVIPVQNKEEPLLKLPLKQLYPAVGWTDGASQMTLDTKCKQVSQVLLRGEVWVLPNVQNKLPWSIMAISASIMDCIVTLILAVMSRMEYHVLFPQIIDL